MGGVAFFDISAICVERRPRWLQDGPKRHPRGPKTAPRSSKRAPRRPKRRQDEPKENPRRPQDGPRSPPSRLQVASKSPSETILCQGSSQEAPKRPQEPPRSPREASKSSQEARRRLPSAPKRTLRRFYVTRASIRPICISDRRMHETGAAVIRRQAF